MLLAPKKARVNVRFSDSSKDGNLENDRITGETGRNVNVKNIGNKCTGSVCGALDQLGVLFKIPMIILLTPSQL